MLTVSMTIFRGRKFLSMLQTKMLRFLQVIATNFRSTTNERMWSKTSVGSSQLPSSSWTLNFGLYILSWSDCHKAQLVRSSRFLMIFTSRIFTSSKYSFRLSTRSAGPGDADCQQIRWLRLTAHWHIWPSWNPSQRFSYNCGTFKRLGRIVTEVKGLI